MDTSIQVSVIMPAYNCEKYIEKAVNSVLLQNEVSLELIVINDCSPDNMDQVMQKYAGDDRIIYLKNQQNLGVAGTRNKGVKLARGRYIAFLDSDDWWESGKLKKQLEMIEREKTVLCSTARRMATPEGEPTDKIIHVPKRMTYKSLLKGNVISCSSVLIRRDVAEQFPMEHEDSHEDYITWLSVLKKYDYACGLDEPLLNYRLSSQGKSGSKLHSAKMTYMAYRYMGFSVFKAAYYFVWYAVNGLVKYI